MRKNLHGTLARQPAGQNRGTFAGTETGMGFGQKSRSSRIERIQARGPQNLDRQCGELGSFTTEPGDASFYAFSSNPARTGAGGGPPPPAGARNGGRLTSWRALAGGRRGVARSPTVAAAVIPLDLAIRRLHRLFVRSAAGHGPADATGFLGSSGQPQADAAYQRSGSSIRQRKRRRAQRGHTTAFCSISRHPSGNP